METADFQVGALKQSVAHQQKAAGHLSPLGPEETALWHLENAADFSGDPVISNTLLLLCELKACGAAEDLVARCSARRANRRRPGGRHRQPGSYELLYLAFVRGGWTARQRFASKLTADVLNVCGFEYVPSPGEINARFAELELTGRRSAG